MIAHVVTGGWRTGRVRSAGAICDEHDREGTGFSGRSRSAADIERARALCSA